MVRYRVFFSGFVDVEAPYRNASSFVSMLPIQKTLSRIKKGQFLLRRERIVRQKESEKGVDPK